MLHEIVVGRVEPRAYYIFFINIIKYLFEPSKKLNKNRFSRGEMAEIRVIRVGENVHIKLIKQLSKCILFDR
jgi:hypothetical protein